MAKVFILSLLALGFSTLAMGKTKSTVKLDDPRYVTFGNGSIVVQNVTSGLDISLNLTDVKPGTYTYYICKYSIFKLTYRNFLLVSRILPEWGKD